MATSNIEAVRGALQSLSEVLDPYIERVTAKLVPAGRDWTVLLAAKDAEKGIRGKEYSAPIRRTSSESSTDRLPRLHLQRPPVPW